MSSTDDDADDVDDDNKVHVSDDNGRNEYIFIHDHDNDKGHCDDNEDHDDEL